MALPVSGQITMFDIAYQLGYSTTNISLGGISYAEGFSQPYSMSNFYGHS